MLQRNLYRHAVLLTLTVNDLRVKSLLASVQVAYKLTDTTLIMEYLLALLSLSLILQNDTKALSQESHLTKSLFQDIIIINSLLKDLLVRKEINLRTGKPRITVTYHLQRIHSLATLISLFVFLTLSVDGNLQPFGKCIYNRCTNTVKTTGNLISSTAELTACVKNGKYNLNCRNTSLMIDTNRNTTTIICNCNGIIRIDIYMDLRTKTSQCFIDCVIHDLIYEMMKSTAGGTSDIHSRPLTYGFQSFQDLDLIRAVFCILCAHVIPPVLVVRTCLKIHFCRTIAASEIITSNPEQDKLIF